MKECFAGGNTRTGFINYLPDLLEGNKTIWLLKGCPGSGKSSFLKRIAALAEDMGLDAYAIRCSSDTDSLDGVVVPDASFAAVDATAPHVIAPAYPVALHKEINMAAFTAVDPAGAQKIIELSDKKARLYAMAYAHLTAAGALRDMLRQAITPYILLDKLNAFAARRTKAVKTAGKAEHRQRTALSKYGQVRLNTFDGAERMIGFGGDADISDIFMDAVLKSARGKKCVFSYDPTDGSRVDEVYFPVEKLLFSAYGGEEEVNVSRFITAEGMAKTRRLRRYVKKQREVLLGRAAELIAEAAVLHGEMEKVYISGTDFERLEGFEAELLEGLSRIFAK